MKFLIQWLYKKLGGEIRLVKMSEQSERDIVSDIAHIDRIKDYLELHKQAGYQLFAKTGDRKYLGWVEWSEHLLFQVNKIIQEEENPEEATSSEGYLSSEYGES